MPLALPNEKIYYYECHNGSFRLSLFIPPSEINALIDSNLISQRVMEDFPDGIDLGCTEYDFQDFEKSYNYRPGFDPAQLREAFFAILSSTNNWQKFTGSGFIPAKEIEHQVDIIEESLKEEDLEPVTFKAAPEPLPLKKFRQTKRQKAAQQKKRMNFLRKFKVDGIDPNKSLAKQEFPKISISEGQETEDVFFKLLRGQKKR